MRTYIDHLPQGPLLARVLPFAIFVSLTALQGKLGPHSPYWIYLAKTIVGAAMIALIWPAVREMRWAFSTHALIVGFLVFALWIGLEGSYPPLNRLLAIIGLASPDPNPTSTWNPFDAFPNHKPLAWFFAAVRIAGSILVVPPLEEVFYRSFLYRYIAKPEFDSLPLNSFHCKAFLITAVIFGLTHREWFPGILCGLAYQTLVLRKNRLGDAILAHAITNACLGAWVLSQHAWHFW